MVAVAVVVALILVVVVLVVLVKRKSSPRDYHRAGGGGTYEDFLMVGLYPNSTPAKAYYSASLLDATKQ